MALRLITVTCDSGHEDTLKAIGDQVENVHYEILPAGEGRTTVSLLAGLQDQQKIIDLVQQSLGSSENWRLVIFPVEAAIPSPEEREEEEEPAGREKRSSAVGISREELYAAMEDGVRLDGNFLLLVVMSTITAAIGLIRDNIAVVIGAMVIAPLLGPNLALILAAALGDRNLMVRAVRTLFVGLALVLVVAFVTGLAFPGERGAYELLSRTKVGLDSVALALASGAAAALSLLTGLSSTLVGVMVAVALLPPAATVALMASADGWNRAIGAALLLAINIVCVNLAGQVVFLMRGVTPRTRTEKAKAVLSVSATIGFWLLALAALTAILVAR